MKVQRRNFALWLALVSSLVAYGIAFLELLAKNADLGLPDRWMGQFAFFLGCSALGAATQFVLYRNTATVSIALLLRLMLLLVATHPLGNYIVVRTTLLTSLVFETMIYLPIPANLAASLGQVAILLIAPGADLAWGRQIGGVTLDSMLFMAFCPLVLMISGGFVNNAQRFASERQNLALQLQKASASLVETNMALQDHVVRSEEQAKLGERERISRELHDTLGYTLMNIIATMKAAKELEKRDHRMMRDFMEKGIEQAQKGLAETRSTLRALRSMEPEPLGVVKAVNRLAAAFDQTHISVRAFYSNLPPQIGRDVEAIIYRIVQEGITNAIRHGNATEIAVHISLDGKNLGVLVSDNGEGADEIKEGLGIAGIRERLKTVGGSLSATNTADGFQLFARMMLKDGGV